jgi:hypothetical protein
MIKIKEMGDTDIFPINECKYSADDGVTFVSNTSC